MKKKKPQRKKLTEFLKNPEELFSEIMKRKPDTKEDFWVFSIIRDDPDYPTWDARMNVLGTYEIAASACVKLVRISPHGIRRIECRSGDAARRLVVNGMQSEVRYRQEISAQPNN